MNKLEMKVNELINIVDASAKKEEYAEDHWEIQIARNETDDAKQNLLNYIEQNYTKKTDK